MNQITSALFGFAALSMGGLAWYLQDKGLLLVVGGLLIFCGYFELLHKIEELKAKIEKKKDE